MRKGGVQTEKSGEKCQLPSHAVTPHLNPSVSALKQTESIKQEPLQAL